MQGRFRYEVDRSTEQLRQLVLETVEREPEVAPGVQHIEQVDVAVLPSLTTGEGTEHQQLRDTKLGAHASQVLTVDGEVELEMVGQVPLVVVSRPASLRVALEKAADARNITLDIRAEINAAVSLDFVSDGLGYSLYSYCGLHDHLVAGQVSAAPVRGFDIEWMLASSKERPLTQATRMFERMLREQAKDAIASGAWHSAVLV